MRLTLCVLAFAIATPAVHADDTLYSPSRPADVLSEMLQWVAQQKGDAELQQKVGAVWATVDSNTPPDVMLERLVEVFGLVNADVQKLLDDCKYIKAGFLAPDADILDDESLTPLVRNNLSLYFGRYLAQRRMFDEALAHLEDLDPAKVVDPASCLFFKSVCQHQLFEKGDALAAINSLLKNTEGVPARYSTVAELMQYELQGIQAKSLDEISKRMADVERRLDLGRAGQRVQKEEKRVVALLDELIEKIEQQQGGGGGNGGPGNQPNGPAGDSQVKGSTAPGQVDDKNVGDAPTQIGLQEQEEARARQAITREFPSRYRTAASQYFKKLAKRKKNAGR